MAESAVYWENLVPLPGRDSPTDETEQGTVEMLYRVKVELLRAGAEKKFIITHEKVNSVEYGPGAFIVHEYGQYGDTYGYPWSEIRRTRVHPLREA